MLSRENSVTQKAPGNPDESEEPSEASFSSAANFSSTSGATGAHFCNPLSLVAYNISRALSFWILYTSSGSELIRGETTIYFNGIPNQGNFFQIFNAVNML
eukprot:jgi/Bigna1/147233/aug1.133_g21941